LERWVSNYKSVGERELTEQERALLQRIAAKARVWVLPLGLSWAASLVAFVAALALVDDTPGWAGLIVLAAVVWLAVSPPAFFAAKRAASDATRDLASGRVEVFEWQANVYAEEPRKSLAVTRGSSRIIAGEGVPRKYAGVRVSEVAATASSDKGAAFPRRLAFSLGGGGIEPIRALSGGEMDELRSFSKKLGGFPYIPGALCLCWFGLAASSAFSGGRDRVDWALTLLLGVLIALSWHRRIKLLRLKARLDKDIEAAIVEEKSPERYPHPPGTRLPQAVEVLPNSNAVWTVDGEPAGWRKTV
jgi:hypothetical protein